MRNNRIISILLTLAMIFTFIPVSAVTVSAVTSANVLDDATISNAGTAVNVEDGNSHLHITNRLNSGNDAFKFTVNEPLSKGQVYYVSFDMRGSFGDTQQRFTANAQGQSLELKDSWTLKANGSDWKDNGSQYYKTFTATCGGGLNHLTPTSVLKDIPLYPISAKNSSHAASAVSVGHYGTFKDTAAGISGGLKDDGYVGFIFGNVKTTWTHIELAYIPANDMSNITISLQRGASSGWGMPIDVDNVKIWCYGYTEDQDGNREYSTEETVVYTDDFESYADTAALCKVYSKVGTNPIIVLETESDYNKYGANAASVSYTDVTLEPGVYTFSGEIRVGNLAGNTAISTTNTNGKVEYTLAGASKVSKAFAYNAMWTEIPAFEIEVEEETELSELVIDFGTSLAVQTRNISLTKTSELGKSVVLSLGVVESAEAGEEITVDVFASSERATAQKLNAFNFALNYDEDVLEFEGIEVELDGTSVDNESAVAWNGGATDYIEVDDEEQLVAVATFTVLDTAKAGVTKITIGSNDNTKLNAKLLGADSTFVPAVVDAEIDIINNADVTIAVAPAGAGTVSATAAEAPVGSKITVDDDTITVGDEEIVAEAGDIYDFAGWFIGEDEITDEYVVVDNTPIEITAKFVVGKGYIRFSAIEWGTLEGAVINQTYEVDAGTVYYVDGNSIKLKSDDTVFATLTSVNEGYKFIGWLIDYELVTGDIVIEKDKTIKVSAKFGVEHPFVIDADVNAGIAEEIEYHVFEGKLYADRECTIPVTELPELNPAVGENERYVFADADKIWLYNGVAMTEAEVLDQEFGFTDELKANLKKQYLVKFVVDDASASIISIAAGASEWADENAEDVEFPEVTKNNEYYDAVWYAGDVKVDAVAKVTAAATYTVKAEAQAITHTVEYKDAEDGSEITVADGDKATVAGGLGEKLVITPKAIAGYVIESVIADGFTLTETDGVWTSDENLEAPAVVIIKYRAYFEVNFTDNDKATVEEVTYYAKDGVDGLYTDTTFATKVIALPEITYAAATADTRYVEAEYAWIVDGTEMTVDEILGAIYTEATEIIPAYETEYKITFAVDADSADYLEIADADAEKWLAAGADIAFPTVTKKVEQCAYEWNTDITSPVEGPAAYVVTATPNAYNVTVKGALAGQVTAAQTATYGTDYTFTVAESDDYNTAVTVKVNGVAVEVTGEYTVAGDDIIGDIEITVANTVTVTIADGDNIKVTAGKEFTVAYGEKLTQNDIDSIALVPAVDFVFAGWLIGDATETVDVISDIAFTKHTTIKPTAKLNTVTVKFEAEANGTVSPAEKEVVVGKEIMAEGNTLMLGGTVIATATADTNYEFKYWDYNGNALESGEVVSVAIGVDNVFTAHFAKISKTATFTATNGTVDKASATVYAGDAIAVNGNVLTVGETVVTATANTNYKFVGWKLNGENITATAVTADGTYAFTAEFAIITKDVTVTAGENGAVNNTAFTANAGDAIAVNGNKLTVGAVTVTATAAEGYKFAGWKLNGAEVTATAITADGTYAFTAEFTYNTVEVTIAAGENGTVDKTTATAVVGNQITTDGASLKIDGVVVATATANTNYKFAGWYAGEEEFTSATVEVGKTYAFTAKFEIVKKTVAITSDANGAVDNATATVDAGKTITADGASLKVDGTAIATATAKAGYKFAGWYAGETVFTSATVTADGTYSFTAKFDKEVFKMTVPAGVSVSVNGGAAVAGGDEVEVEVKIGDSVVITPDADAMVTGVSFNGTAITASEGKYTVPADKITANVEITVTAIEYTFISAEEYKALASEDYKILAIAADANDTDYTYGDYEFFYSSKYEAYVAIIGKDLTAAEIGQTITSKAGSETAVKYDGDVNGDGTVSAADAAIISEILHAYNTDSTVAYTDIMRFEADAYGTYTADSAYVTTRDCSYVLYKSVGLDYPTSN